MASPIIATGFTVRSMASSASRLAPQLLTPNRPTRCCGACPFRQGEAPVVRHAVRRVLPAETIGRDQPVYVETVEANAKEACLLALGMRRGAAAGPLIV